MKKILILFLSILCLSALAQTKKEVKFDTSEGKYYIKIITEVDGKATTIERTYSSIEEMKNDPDLKDIKLHLIDKSSNAFFISSDDADADTDVNVIVNVDSDVEMTNKKGQKIMIKTDGDSEGGEQEIKVWVDEEGNRHVIKNGKEIEGNTWTSDDGKTIELKEGDDMEMKEVKVIVDEDGERHILINGEEIEDGNWSEKDGKSYDIKSGDGKVMIFSEKGMAEFITEDDETMDLDFTEEEGVSKKVVIIKSISAGENEDGDIQKNISIKVIERINLHFEELGENEFTEMPKVDAKELAMEDLNYYPNPNSGKFTLAFKADKKPTQIKITSVDGKEVYAEELQGFEGSYNNEIDLSDQKRGIYLLQIIQGRKAINKKIVIE